MTSTAIAIIIAAALISLSLDEIAKTIKDKEDK